MKYVKIGLVKAKRNKKTGKLEFRIYDQFEKKYITEPMTMDEMKKLLSDQGLDEHTRRRSLQEAAWTGTSQFGGPPEDLDREKW